MDESKYTDCPLCSKGFTDPRILPCNHTFCLECLKNTLETKNTEPINFTCPKCDVLFVPPEESLENLKKNDFVQNLNKMASVKFCEICSENNVGCFCVDCKKYFCSKCSNLHLKLPAVSNHVIEKLDGAPVETHVAKSRYEMCELHEELIKLYCTQCNECACMMCFVEKHNKHDMVSLSTQMISIREGLKKYISNLQNKHSEAEKELENVETSVKNCDIQAESLKKEIDDRSESLKLVIELHRQELLNLVNRNAEAYKEQGCIIKQRLSYKMSELTSKIETSGGDLNNVSVKTICEMRSKKEIKIPSLNYKFSLNYTPSKDENFSGLTNFVGSIAEDQNFKFFEGHKYDRPVLKMALDYDDTLYLTSLGDGIEVLKASFVDDSLSSVFTLKDDGSLHDMEVIDGIFFFLFDQYLLAIQDLSNPDQYGNLNKKIQLDQHNNKLSKTIDKTILILHASAVSVISRNGVTSIPFQQTCYNPMAGCVVCTDSDQYAVFGVQSGYGLGQAMTSGNPKVINPLANIGNISVVSDGGNSHGAFRVSLNFTCVIRHQSNKYIVCDAHNKLIAMLNENYQCLINKTIDGTPSKVALSRKLNLVVVLDSESSKIKFYTT